MDGFDSSRIASQYDVFQASLEALAKEKKFLNYGFTVSSRQTYEERQERLCLEVFKAAGITEGHTVVDVGFGSGEQDFLLAKTCRFDRVTGFNISPRQVEYASARARTENLADRLSFNLGEAESLPGVADNSVDRLIAIECAFYFDRPRFYRRAAAVLKPGGLLVAADMSISGRLAFLTRRDKAFQRFGTRTANRLEWEKHFTTRSIRDINHETRPGAQMTVFKILRTAPFVREWLTMAWNTQLIVAGLWTALVHYDLIVLEKTASYPCPDQCDDLATNSTSITPSRD